MGFDKLKIFIKKYKKEIQHVSLCIIGSFILAFGTAAFLIPANIVAGGTSGIGVIVSYFVKDALGTRFEDIVVWAINIALLIVAFFFVGKKFALHTLVSTLFFPAFFTLMIRTPMISWISDYFTMEYPITDPTGLESLKFVLAAIFSGITIGGGVALTFLGEGSTGGLDIPCFILYKHFRIKQSITSFAFDASIIITYAFIIPDRVLPSLVGVVSALISAIMIEVLYIRVNSNYVVDILTNKYLEINKYIIKELKSTTTLLDATGSYSKKKYKLVRFVVGKRNFKQVRERITKIDPDAFVTIIDANNVLGEGFIEINHKKH